MPDPVLRAIIYLRNVDDHRCLYRCQAHCDRHGYRVVGIVVDPTGERWADVAIAGFAGEYEVLVFCPQDLIPGRVPRMEPADDPDGPPRLRRADEI